MRKTATTILLTILIPIIALAQERFTTSPIKIWRGTPIYAPSVTLTPYHADTRQPATAIIVCPGGSYCWHDRKNEGRLVAQYLQQQGITAFVLNYRVQGMFQYGSHARLLYKGNQHPAMIMDAQRALQYIREHAQELHIAPDRVGIMGFSAGGHLAMSAASYHHTDFLARRGINSTVSLRPDFVAPIYPVVTMTEDVTHRRSRRALLGEYRKWNKTLRDSLSVERHIPQDCPPVFLANCKDDPVVKYQNSVMLDSALTARGIPHTYIQYQTGGHGFGASDTKGTAESREWKQAFIQWLKTIKML